MLMICVIKSKSFHMSRVWILVEIWNTGGKNVKRCLVSGRDVKKAKDPTKLCIWRKNKAKYKVWGNYSSGESRKQNVRSKEIEDICVMVDLTNLIGRTNIYWVSEEKIRDDWLKM